MSQNKLQAKGGANDMPADKYPELREVAIAAINMWATNETMPWDTDASLEDIEEQWPGINSLIARFGIEKVESIIELLNDSIEDVMYKEAVHLVHQDPEVNVLVLERA